MKYYITDINNQETKDAPAIDHPEIKIPHTFTFIGNKDMPDGQYQVTEIKKINRRSAVCLCIKVK